MAMRTGRRWAATGLAAALVLAGCSGSGEEASPGGNAGRQVGPWPEASFASALEPYDSCGALLEDVQARAAERVGPYGLEGTSSVGFATSRTFEETGAAIDVATDGPVASAPAAAPDAAQRSSNVGDGSGSSTTNTQVAGVDEPDLVKTDGTTLYSTLDGRLSIVDLAGDTPVLQGSLDLPTGTQGGGGIPAGIDQPQLLVEGDRVLAIAQGWGGDGGDGPMTDDLPNRWTPGGPSTELTLVDVADRTAPRILERLSVDGTLLGARLVDGRAHLVTSTGGPRLDFVYPTGNGGEPVAEATNQKVIETSVIEDWLPQARTLGPDGELRRAGPAVACEAVSHPGVDAGEGTVTVLSVDVDGGTLADHDATAVQAAGETIYASGGTLYVATHQMPPPEAFEDPAALPATGLVTSIHAFDLAEAGPAAYLATGEVEGRLLNQFAMDEHEGVLRVATTVDGAWGPGADGTSESFVTTLERRDGDLVELGKVGDMGRGEQIHSVRFLGEVGYVVTFRQVDPLYTIDLSDPASPTVTGELKIPGFSSYLHPTEAGKLIGIGQDADPETGMTTGTQVSVFDVSDPANPLRTAQWTLPGGSSTAEGDHHAFLWWAAEDLLVVPMSSSQIVPMDDAQRGVPTWFEGAIGLDVTDAAIGERGRIVHEPRPWVEPTPPEPEPTTTTSTSSTTTSTTAPPSSTTTTTAPSTTTTEPTTTSVVCVEPDCGPGERDGADEAATSVAPEPGIPAPVPPGPVPAPPLPGPGAPIVRSLVVEGRLVTVSHLGIEVSRLSDLTELGWLTIAR